MMAIMINVLKLVGTLGQLLIALLRPRSTLAAENLFLRRQLALYQDEADSEPGALGQPFVREERR